MPANAKVLLVESNPPVRELLRKALASISEVATAVSIPEAKARLEADPPDLLVADYSVEDRKFLTGLRQSAAAPLLVLLVSRDLAGRVEGGPEMAEDVIEKPFFIREATARIKRVIDRVALKKLAPGFAAGMGSGLDAKGTKGEQALRGSLLQMNVTDLLQSLELARKTCRLRLTRAGDTSDLYFVDGQIRHAAYGLLAGDEAVFHALTWKEGDFEIDFGASVAQQTITRTTQGLLMEGLRLLDEANRDEDVLES